MARWNFSLTIALGVGGDAGGGADHGRASRSRAAFLPYDTRAARSHVLSEPMYRPARRSRVEARNIVPGSLRTGLVAARSPHRSLYDLPQRSAKCTRRLRAAIYAFSLTGVSALTTAAAAASQRWTAREMPMRVDPGYRCSRQLRPPVRTNRGYDLVRAARLPQHERICPQKRRRLRASARQRAVRTGRAALVGLEVQPRRKLRPRPRKKSRTASATRSPPSGRARDNYFPRSA